jgi:hypothetical protein
MKPWFFPASKQSMVSTKAVTAQPIGNMADILSPVPPKAMLAMGSRVRLCFLVLLPNQYTVKY